MYRVINKPWGKEVIIEENEFYVIKLLHINTGARLSLQYHEVKTETLFLIDGEVKFTLGDSVQESNTMFEKWHVEPGVIHRMEGINDCVLLEVSTPELDDVIRLEDDYNRRDDKVVAVSGGFDPVHPGHIRMFKEARKLGTKLVVILNNDNWLLRKKGYVFMNQELRKEVLEALGCVDEVVITGHSDDPVDMSVCDALAEIRPDVFANGGDRFSENVPEVETCKLFEIDMVFNVGGSKMASSSELVNSVR